MSVHQPAPPPGRGSSRDLDIFAIMDTLAMARTFRASLQSSSAQNLAPAPRSSARASVRPPSPSIASSSSSPSTASVSSCFSRSEKAALTITTTATSVVTEGATLGATNTMSNENDDHPLTEGGTFDVMNTMSYDNDDHPLPFESNPLILCEFHQFNGCEERFAVDDVVGLVEHMAVAHLHHNYPPRCICWWCDGPQGEFFTDSVHQSDRVANFHSRMEHIAEHYHHAGYVSQPRRPDFHLMEFLLQENLVGQSLKARLVELSELKRPDYWEEEVPPGLPREKEQSRVVSTTSGRGRVRERMYHI